MMTAVMIVMTMMVMVIKSYSIIFMIHDYSLENNDDNGLVITKQASTKYM